MRAGTIGILRVTVQQSDAEAPLLHKCQHLRGCSFRFYVNDGVSMVVYDL